MIEKGLLFLKKCWHMAKGVLLKTKLASHTVKKKTTYNAEDKKPYNLLEPFQYSVQEASVQVWRHPFLSLATFGLGVMLVFFMTALFAVKSGVNVQWDELESRADFSILMAESYDSFELEALLNALNKYEITPSVSQKTSWNGILIPPRLRVSFTNLEDLKPVFQILKNPRYTELIPEWNTEDEVSFVSVVESILKLKQGTEKTILFMVVLFLLGGILLYFYTFQMVAYSRKEEIFIAKSVGADFWFILGPFVAEGAMLGFFSGFMGVVLFIVALTQVPFGFTGQIFADLWDTIFLLEIIMSGLIGAFGAYMSGRWFLHQE